MVYVAHHGNHRRTFHQVFFAVRFLLLDLFRKLCGDEFHLVAEFFGHQNQGFGIQTLVDGYHHAQGHAGADHLHHRGVVHEGGQVVHRHELRHFQDFVLCGGGFHLLLGTKGGNLALLLAVLGAEIVARALVHLGVGFLYLLLDLLLHFFLLGLGHGGLEALALLAALGRLCSRGIGLLLVGLLGGLVGLHLGHVHFLGAAALDAFALFGAFGIELGQVNLAHHLEGSVAGLGGRRFRRGLGGRFFCLGFRFGLYYRLGFFCGLRLRFGFRFRLGLYNGFRFGFGNGLRLRLRFGFGNGFRFRFRNGLRFRFHHGLAGQVVALDHGYALRLELVLFVVLFPGSLVQDFGELDIHFFRGFLQFQVLAELFVQFRQVFVRDLQVRIGVFDAGAFGIEELHQGVQPDVKLFNQFR